MSVYAYHLRPRLTFCAGLTQKPRPSQHQANHARWSARSGRDVGLQRVYPRALKADLAQSKTYSFLVLVCPNGCVTSAHKRHTCGDR